MSRKKINKCPYCSNDKISTDDRIFDFENDDDDIDEYMTYQEYPYAFKCNVCGNIFGGTYQFDVHTFKLTKNNFTEPFRIKLDDLNIDYTKLYGIPIRIDSLEVKIESFERKEEVNDKKEM